MTNPRMHDLPTLSGHMISKTPSYNEILPRLYLGDIGTAVNKQEIMRLGITDMITVEIKPLLSRDVPPSVKRHLYICAMDHSKQDMLSHFEVSNKFLETALEESRNKVYVHCVAGISRSATLVIAYIMKTRSMNYSEAFELVSQKRKIIDPNEGFVRQLNLYHKMKYTVDIGNLAYRRMVLDALVFEFRLVSLSYYQVPPTGSTSSNSPGGSGLMNSKNVDVLFDHYFGKLNLRQVSKSDDLYPSDRAFRCNRCGVVVFYPICIIDYFVDDEKDHAQNTSRSSSGSRQPAESTAVSKGQDKICPFVFIEPQPWMWEDILEHDGTLYCYRCKQKLGKYDWTSAQSCSCVDHNSIADLSIFKMIKKKVNQL